MAPHDSHHHSATANWYPDSRGHSAPTLTIWPCLPNPRREFLHLGDQPPTTNYVPGDANFHARGFPANLVASQPIANITTTMAVGSRSARPSALSTAIIPANSTTSSNAFIDVASQLRASVSHLQYPAQSTSGTWMSGTKVCHALRKHIHECAC